MIDDIRMHGSGMKSTASFARSGRLTRSIILCKRLRGKVGDYLNIQRPFCVFLRCVGYVYMGGGGGGGVPPPKLPLGIGTMGDWGDGTGEP
jgi:hypothetical protein